MAAVRMGLEHATYGSTWNVQLSLATTIRWAHWNLQKVTCITWFVGMTSGKPNGLCRVIMCKVQSTSNWAFAFGTPSLWPATVFRSIDLLTSRNIKLFEWRGDRSQSFHYKIASRDTEGAIYDANHTHPSVAAQVPMATDKVKLKMLSACCMRWRQIGRRVTKLGNNFRHEGKILEKENNKLKMPPSPYPGSKQQRGLDVTEKKPTWLIWSQETHQNDGRATHGTKMVIERGRGHPVTVSRER